MRRGRLRQPPGRARRPVRRARAGLQPVGRRRARRPRARRPHLPLSLRGRPARGFRRHRGHDRDLPRILPGGGGGPPAGHLFPLEDLPGGPPLGFGRPQPRRFGKRVAARIQDPHVSRQQAAEELHAPVPGHPASSVRSPRMSVSYTIHNADVLQRERRCPSLLTEDESATFLETGVVVPEAKLSAAQLQVLEQATDALVGARFGDSGERTYTQEFAGQYIRDPHRRDPRFLTVPLLDYPLADTVRNLLGPRIVLRNSNIRVTRPGSGDGTVWHTDFRPHVSPPPPLGAAPAVITVLLYLDPPDAEVGPLYVVRRSHLRAEQPAPEARPLPDEQEMTVSPGQVVLMNSAVWHRGGQNVSASRTRRLITLQFSTVFMAPFNFEQAEPSADYLALVADAFGRRDEPLLELLGLGGLDPKNVGY
ncbi:phytanoyl-CoA dioxygenase family protein [Microbispora cellulosiformans]|uniref:Phytanoyl-CoA dioxygenase family protein n=2 Tax=Microbispora cellulosiformans TaxID=2614688 RepID=A0A5J5JYL6_9ACTN|nr:phytanoyl-CoA dioxygenase family protein [Microbispora cellulosiformans]